jgi:ComF family protein
MKFRKSSDRRFKSTANLFFTYLTTMRLLPGLKESLLHLAFPHICAGCGTDVLDKEHALCLRCLHALPKTGFHPHAGNPVEKLFWGRLPVEAATAQFYFTKSSLMQHLMHRFKYRGDKTLGSYLGRLMGNRLQETDRFATVDALVPLPLFAAKERRRGFNQSAILCQGIAEVLQKPVYQNKIIRTAGTESQTKKNRSDRWQNVEGRFEWKSTEGMAGKHLLLVDDVVTTGATLEACGRTILQEGSVRLSVAALCVASE